LHKRRAEADAKLERLYDALEDGIVELTVPILTHRITELVVTAAPEAVALGSGKVESSDLGPSML
jgi:hypothetical protein